MKIIPQHVWDKNGRIQGGEPLVFSLLSQFNLGKFSKALHSLNLIGNQRQRAFEIDFLILTERAIVGLEVKAGLVTCKEGVWRVHKDNGGVAYTKYKSPYVQAADALHQLRTQWIPAAFGERSAYSKIPYVPIAVLCKNSLPDKHFDNPAEMPREFIVWKEDLTPETLKSRINDAIDFSLKNVLNHNVMLSEREVDELSYRLRPEIDVTYPSSSELSDLELQQNSLTERQYRLVDKFRSFDRLVIDGGAGTGKTFALIYGARQEVELGNKVLVITDAPQLRRHLSDALINEQIVVQSSEGISSCEDSDFDSVFVDEGQDVCNESTVASIDRVLKGGIGNGRWRWFGDFENQFDPAKKFDSEVLDLIVSFTGNAAKVVLDENVRNTPNIVKWLENYCSARLGETFVKGNGPEVRLVDNAQVQRWFESDGYLDTFGELQHAEIVVLVPSKSLKSHPLVQKLARLGFLVELIEDFKGMESRVVVIAGLEMTTDASTLSDLLYKSVSRSKGMVFVIVDDNLKTRIFDLSRG